MWRSGHILILALLAISQMQAFQKETRDLAAKLHASGGRGGLAHVGAEAQLHAHATST